MAMLRTVKGAFVRLLFLLHTSLCVYRLVVERDYWGWWMLGAGIGVLLFVEAGITLECKKHGEWRRFVPCIFIYLAGAVPALCLIEWTILQKRLEYQDETGDCSSFTHNTTSSLTVPGVPEINYNWSLALQQLLVMLLVMGRWLLPKGKMCRERLSNILLAYIGVAADNLEFYSEGIKTEQIRCNETVVLVILCLWAISLVQFSLDLGPGRRRLKSVTQINETLIRRCGNPDVWSIIVTVFTQDGPFLATRLYLIIKYNILDQGLIFFTFKNALIVLLQLYRMWILLCLTWDAKEGKFSFRLTTDPRPSDKNEGNNNRHFSTTSVERDNSAFDSNYSDDEESIQSSRGDDRPGPREDQQYAYGRNETSRAASPQEPALHPAGFGRNAPPQERSANSHGNYYPDRPQSPRHHENPTYPDRNVVYNDRRNPHGGRQMQTTPYSVEQHSNSQDTTPYSREQYNNRQYFGRR